MSDFELLDASDIPLYVQAIEFLRSCTLESQRSSWLSLQLQSFCEPHPNVAVCTDALLGEADIPRFCDEQPSTVDTIVVPLVLSGLIPHVVAVVVDRSLSRVVYYDSHGRSPIHETRTLPSGTGVLALLCQLSRGFVLLYSPLVEQRWYNILSCGANTKCFIERYVLMRELVFLRSVGRPRVLRRALRRAQS
jgi:hypothetical protein